MHKDNLDAINLVSCVICGSSDYGHICYSRTARIVWLKTPIVICRKCGFIYVNPRWTSEQYSKINDLYFCDEFLNCSPPDSNSREKKNNMHGDRMRERIQLYFPNGIRNLLDIGARGGWCFEYFKKFNPFLKSFAIERLKLYCQRMENTYGTVIVANDINGDWDIQYKNTFDLVVLRHTLEHLLEPKKNLEQICQALTDNGYLYIEVPSLRNNQHLLFNDFFRPSHLSYFCKETLESLTRNAGLKPVILREEKGLGLWGLFKKGSTESIKPDVYGEMKRIIRERHSRVYSNDLKLLLKIKLLNLLRIAGVYEPSVRKQCC